MPQVSVIIPAFNEERYIRKAVGSLKEQSFNDLEVIVVDNSSTDDTACLCGDADRILGFADVQSSGAARNYGAANSDSQYLAFLDADSTLSENAIENALMHMDLGYVGSRCVIEPPEDKLPARIQAFTLNNWARFIAPQYTPYIFCSRDAFDKAGGWPEEGQLGEELVFQRKLKKFGRIAFDKASSVKTSPRRYQKEGYLKTALLGVLGYYGARINWRPVRE